MVAAAGEGRCDARQRGASVPAGPSSSSRTTVSIARRLPAATRISVPPGTCFASATPPPTTSARHDPPFDRRKHQRALGGPVEHVRVHGPLPVGADPPGSRQERPAARAVDGLAVDLQPGADLAEPVGLSRLDLAGRHRADVQQQVAVAAGAGDQRPHALVERLHRVVGLPRPLLADGDAGLPRPVGLEPAHLLLGGVVVAAEGPGGGGAGHVLPALRHAVVDDERRLQGPAVAVEVLPALLRPGLFPLAVEPEDPERPVGLQQLRELALQVGRVAIHVRGRACGSFPPGSRAGSPGAASRRSSGRRRRRSPRRGRRPRARARRRAGRASPRCRSR